MAKSYRLDAKIEYIFSSVDEKDKTTTFLKEMYTFTSKQFDFFRQIIPEIFQVFLMELTDDFPPIYSIQVPDAWPSLNWTYQNEEEIDSFEKLTVCDRVSITSTNKSTIIRYKNTLLPTPYTLFPIRPSSFSGAFSNSNSKNDKHYGSSRR